MRPPMNRCLILVALLLGSCAEDVSDARREAAEFETEARRRLETLTGRMTARADDSRTAVKEAREGIEGLSKRLEPVFARGRKTDALVAVMKERKRLEALLDRAAGLLSRDDAQLREGWREEERPRLQAQLASKGAELPLGLSFDAQGTLADPRELGELRDALRLCAEKGALELVARYPADAAARAAAASAELTADLERHRAAKAAGDSPAAQAEQAFAAGALLAPRSAPPTRETAVARLATVTRELGGTSTSRRALTTRTEARADESFVRLVLVVKEPCAAPK